jgi:hypothetical protein
MSLWEWGRDESMRIACYQWFLVILSVVLVAWLLFLELQKSGERTDSGAGVSRERQDPAEPVKEAVAELPRAPVGGGQTLAEDARVSPSPQEDAAGARITLHAGPANGADGTPRVEVRRVLAERWLDAETKDSRRRMRVVETDFKYPLLRIE